MTYEERKVKATKLAKDIKKFIDEYPETPEYTAFLLSVTIEADTPGDFDTLVISNAHIEGARLIVAQLKEQADAGLIGHSMAGPEVQN